MESLRNFDLHLMLIFFKCFRLFVSPENSLILSFQILLKNIFFKEVMSEQ